MGIDRRDFLRIAGIASLWGIGGKTAFEILKPGAVEAENRVPLSPGKKWSMIIDTRKFKTQEDFQRCIDACNKAHNIPQSGQCAPGDQMDLERAVRECLS